MCFDLEVLLFKKHIYKVVVIVKWSVKWSYR